MTARDTALSVLIACRRQQAWSDGMLKHQIAKDRLDRRDAALATRLCFGVLQNRLLLDHWISLFLKGKPESLQPVVLDILRLGVCQLKFSDKLPPSAVVNEAVEQAKRFANPKAAGLVNAVLRAMLRKPERLTLPDDLWLRYSHPKELTELLRQSVGDERLEALLSSHNEAPDACLQINTLRCTAAQAEESLASEGFSAKPHPWLPDCLLLTGGSLEQSEAFREGFIYAQDAAARLAVLAALPQPDMRVLDCCAAPGGKSFAAAICMKDRGELISCDIHAHKLELIRKGAERLRLSCIRPRLQDATEPVPEWKQSFDAVLADVPCSGLGVIRKKPDIRYKNLAQTERLPALQGKILSVQADYVRPGGVLLYSTCTVLKRENEAVVDAFLRERQDFVCEPFRLPGELFAERGMLTLLPCEHGTDGFFMAKLRRRT